MKRDISIISLLLVAAMFSGFVFKPGNKEKTEKKKTFYDYKVLTIDGKEFDLSKLKGKKVMVVNTASKCGNTPQYEILEKLYGSTYVIN